MRKYNHITLSIHGVNLKRLIKQIYKNKIDIFNLNFIDFKNLEITINVKDYKKIKSMLTNYNYKVVNNYGISLFKQYFFTHLGIFVGVVFFIIMLILNNNFLSKIYIIGNSRITSEEITTFLSENNIKQNTFFNNLNSEDIENLIEQNFTDVSLVSVIKKGTNLIINIKEKLYVEDVLQSVDIISSVNGQIIEMDVIQGTVNKKVGDSVKVGDVLVSGYSLNNGVKVECKAIAKIKMKVWYSSSYNFLNEEVIVERTGKVINNTYYKIFNKLIPIKVKKVNFENYEKETSLTYLTNNLILPTKVYSEKFYEIKENLQKNDFSLQKDAIIEETEKQAYKLVPQNFEVIEKSVEIQEFNWGKIVSVYLQTIQEFG